MPTINKTTFKPRAKAGGALGRIQSVTTLPLDGIKMIVYGQSKTGKTSLVATFPKPCLILGTEDGTRSVKNVRGLDFVMLEKSTDLDELVPMLREGKYKSIGLDTAGGLQDLILKEVLGLDEIPIQKSWGLTDRQTWGTVGAQTKERLRSLLDLAGNGTHVVVIAYERNFNEEGGNSDLIFPTVGAALTPSVAGWLNAASHYICQTYIRGETERTEMAVGTKKVPMVQKTGRKQYCLRVGPHEVYMTGFRCLRKGTDLPECIVDPDYQKIVKLIGIE
jgi:hypothetical protein